MMFSVNVEIEQYNGQFIEVSMGSKGEFRVDLKIADGVNSPEPLVELKVHSVQRAMTLANDMQIPIKFSDYLEQDLT